MCASAVNNNAFQHVLSRANKVVLFADVVDSVRLVEADEEGVIRRWIGFVDETEQKLTGSGHGRLVKRLGDGFLAEFADANHAARAALGMQSEIARLNESLDPESHIELRIGLDFGEVLHSADDDLYGQHVNMAARLASATRPGQILASARVRDVLASDPETDLEDIGELYLKNVSQPTRAYLVRGPESAGRPVPRLALDDLLPTIAVLPLSMLIDTETEPVWPDLLADNLIGALARSNELNVISRLSTASLGGLATDPGRVRAALGADFVLTGTCWQTGRKTGVELELVETMSGLIVWSSRQECDALEILQRNSIFSDLANRMHMAIVKREMNRAISNPLPTLEGYALFFGAVALMNRLSQRDFSFSGELLDELIQRVPHAPAALAWKARWHVLKVQQGWATDAMAEARQALDRTERALDIDPQNTAALVAQGFVCNNLMHDLDEAQELFDSAIEITPNDASARALRAALYTFRGEGPPAVRDAERALHVAPLDPNRFFFQAMAAGASFANNDYERALELAESSLRLNRSHTSTLRIKAVSELRLGHADRARATMAKLITKQPNFSISWWEASSPAANYPMGRAFVQSLKELGVPD